MTPERQRPPFVPYLLLTLAVLGWAGNWVIGRALRFDAPPVAITFWRWAIAFALLGIAYIGVVATVVGYLVWNGVVQEVGPARAGPFMYLMLVFTPILSIIFLDERLHLYHLVGAALIVAGIYLTTFRSSKL